MRQNKAAFLFGMTCFEFMIAVCIFLFLVYFFTNRTYQIWAETERATFQQIVNTLRTSLYYAMIKSREGYLKMPESCVNPMDFVANPPSNYLGVLDHPADSSELDGHWYFDRQQCLLAYQWRFTKLLNRLKTSPHITQFTVEITPIKGTIESKKHFIIKEVDRPR